MIPTGAPWYNRLRRHKDLNTILGQQKQRNNPIQDTWRVLIHELPHIWKACKIVTQAPYRRLKRLFPVFLLCSFQCSQHSRADFDQDDRRSVLGPLGPLLKLEKIRPDYDNSLYLFRVADY